MILFYNFCTLFPTACSQIGAIRGTEQGQRNDTCGVVVNYTNIEVCEGDGWREVCDETFTQQDAKVVCWQLNFSDIGTYLQCMCILNMMHT